MTTIRQAEPTSDDPVVAAILDFGGVMTAPVTTMFKRFARAVGLTTEESRAVIDAVYRGGAAGDGAIQQLELGAIGPAELERHLARAIADVTGRTVPPEGLFHQLWGLLELDAAMVEGIRRLRSAGVRTALLSNSWGADNYPFDALDGVFELYVISGVERVRKPDAEIYRRTLDRLDLRASQCVFVDDLAPNVEVAHGLGMHGIVHRDAVRTLAQLEALCLPSA